jgi:type II secretory pathway component GspD/PulD (secretin)
MKRCFKWQFLAIFCWGTISISGYSESPILGYKNEITTKSEKFYSIALRNANTYEILPLLRSLCRDCNWVAQHSRQVIGLKCSNEDWNMYRSAIRSMDKKNPLIGLSLDVIEVSNIHSERYQQLFANLTSPIRTDDALDMMVQLMVSSGNASIVSSPRLIGRSGQPILLNVGDKVPYKTTIHQVNSIQSNIQYIQSGIQINITPHVFRNHRIDLNIELIYNVVSGYRIEDGVEMPIVASRTSKLSVQVKENQSIMFAGLLDQNHHESIEKVPIFGNIPWIGKLFQKKVLKKEWSDLVFKIRPTIVDYTIEDQITLDNL